MISGQFEDISDADTLTTPNRYRMHGDLPSMGAVSMMPSPANNDQPINTPEQFDFKETSLRFKETVSPVQGQLTSR